MKKKVNPLVLILLAVSSFVLSLSSCTEVNVFEKNEVIPHHQWDSSFKPTVDFDITDTAVSYNILLVLRHTDAYNFNNIWVRITSKAPGDTLAGSQRFDLPLASQNQWTGSGMDDIFEHRILLYDTPKKFVRSGRYSVTIQQVMRENPLQHVLNVGLRVEKVK